MRKRCTIAIAALICLLNNVAVAASDDDYDRARKSLDTVKVQITRLLKQQEKDCLPTCHYVQRFSDAQKAWEEWVEAEFLYENYEMGGAGSVMGRMLTDYRTEQMNLRVEKLTHDLQSMKGSSSDNK